MAQYLVSKKLRELISAEPIFQYNVSGLGAIFSPSASCTHCSSCGYFWQRENIISSYLAKFLFWQFYPPCWNNLHNEIKHVPVPSSVAHSNITLQEKPMYLSSTDESCLGGGWYHLTFWQWDLWRWWYCCASQHRCTPETLPAHDVIADRFQVVSFLVPSTYSNYKQLGKAITSSHAPLPPQHALPTLEIGQRIFFSCLLLLSPLPKFFKF